MSVSLGDRFVPGCVPGFVKAAVTELPLSKAFKTHDLGIERRVRSEVSRDIKK